MREPLRQATPLLGTEGLPQMNPISGRESHSFPEIRGTWDNSTGNPASPIAVAIPAHVWESYLHSKSLVATLRGPGFPASWSPPSHLCGGASWGKLQWQHTATWKFPGTRGQRPASLEYTELGHPLPAPSPSPFRPSWACCAEQRPPCPRPSLPPR